MRNFLEMSGNNFEVGKQLGRFWGDYFAEQRHLNGIIKQYPSWLREYNIPRNPNDPYRRLYENTKTNFPDLIEEIEGMAKGINESKLATISEKDLTAEQVFLRCVHEEGRSCISAIFKKKKGADLLKRPGKGVIPYYFCQ